MATESNIHRNLLDSQSAHEPRTENVHKPDGKTQFPPWFCPETGISTSKFGSIQLPTDPNLDVVSFIFSHPHHGNSALIDSSSGDSISYSHLFPLVKSIALGLHHLGVANGDVVLILLPNSIYYPIIALGILHLGAIIAPMNPLSSFSEVKRQTVDCRASWAFTTSTSHLQAMKELGVTPIEVPDISKPISEIHHQQYRTFHKLISIEPRITSAFTPKVNQDDIGAYMSSSGTTGASKCAMISHRNLIAMVQLFVRFEASIYRNEISWCNVYVAVVPMFHIYGLALFVTGLLSLGTTIVVMRRFDVDEAVIAVDKFGVTHFPVVPPILRALTLKAKNVAGRPFKSLKQVSCGAASITREAINDLVATLPHVDFIQGYGMTESTAMGTRGLNTKTFRNYTSVGLLLPNTEARVVDCVTGSFLSPGKAGELWLRSPGTMQGYLNNREATALTIVPDGNWLRTADLAYIDRDGYLYILERIKDIIKYKGYQVAPADLEAILITHPDIVDVAVAGAPDEDAGEVPVAFVVRRPESKLSSNEVMNYVAPQVAPYKKVRRVVFVPSLPKSAAGKILKRQLRSSLSSSRI